MTFYNIFFIIKIKTSGCDILNYIQEIINYCPKNNQEINDKKNILNYISLFPNNILTRDNEIAHITSSGFILSNNLNKALMIHHNIRNAWAWTGGHADGDPNLLHVALKEAKEETGIKNVYPLTSKIASIDILPVYGHYKNGNYISAHLHLSISYILITNESEILKVKPDENSGVKWFDVLDFNENNFDENDIYLYGKLINRAKS